MNMPTYRPILATLVLAAAVACTATAQELPKGEQATIFIGPLEVKSSVRELAKTRNRELQLSRISESLDTQFIAALSGTRVFQLVERNRIKDLQVEQAFIAVAGDPNDKNAAQALKFAGAKYAFLPQIDGFEDRTITQEHAAIARVSASRTVYLSAAVKIVDTTTGTLLPDCPSFQLSMSNAVAMAMSSEALDGDQLFVDLAKEMAGRLSQSIVSVSFPPKVLSVDGKQIMINRGTNAGFSTDDVVEIYATKDVLDKESMVHYLNEIAVGRARIVRGDALKSFALIEGDDVGIAVDCVVKVVPPAKLP